MATKELIKEIQVDVRKEKGKLYVIFIDFSKAFDTANRKR